MRQQVHGGESNVSESPAPHFKNNSNSTLKSAPDDSPRRERTSPLSGKELTVRGSRRKIRRGVEDEELRATPLASCIPHHALCPHNSVLSPKKMKRFVHEYSCVENIVLVPKRSALSGVRPLNPIVDNHIEIRAYTCTLPVSPYPARIPHTLHTPRTSKHPHLH